MRVWSGLVCDAVNCPFYLTGTAVRTAKACVHSVNTQSALSAPGVGRCCSPVIRAGFTLPVGKSQSRPVAEHWPPAWRQDQISEVQCGVHIPVVAGPASPACPGPFPLEFRVHGVAGAAGLAAGIPDWSQGYGGVSRETFVDELTLDFSHSCVGTGPWVLVPASCPPRSGPL